MFRKQPIELALLFLATSLLAACATQPTQVKADIPLVHSYYKQVSEQYNLQQAKIIPLENPVTGQAILIDQQRFEVGPEYFSALGQLCFKLHPVYQQASLSSPSRSICKTDDGWMALAPLVTFQPHNSDGFQQQ
ncbi:hypothetical protein DXV75_14240 [Alteromonas aestuariivivens]|uniref:Uncharacterized protein n=2 Tax=Alteromonas aestuariivivens TaxID=1938339 RepID=A0A3D8M3R6_9ALTE|nr:hypothetical protein DXV75_14240 [Alteromonas aestuariivivens]